MPMKRILACLAVLCVPLLGVGCASIFTGSSQAIAVDSEPRGAQIQMDGIALGTTPAQITVKRGTSHALVISKDGYESATAILGTKFNGWFLANLLFGGLIGMAIDLATGAYVWVDPEYAKVILNPKGR
jgi:PEGA domain-containing protein